MAGEWRGSGEGASSPTFSREGAPSLEKEGARPHHFTEIRLKEGSQSHLMVGL